jgi:hypothetical protein
VGDVKSSMVRGWNALVESSASLRARQYGG